MRLLAGVIVHLLQYRAITSCKTSTSYNEKKEKLIRNAKLQLL